MVYDDSDSISYNKVSLDELDLAEVDLTKIDLAEVDLNRIILDNISSNGTCHNESNNENSNSKKNSKNSKNNKGNKDNKDNKDNKNSDKKDINQEDINSDESEEGTIEEDIKNSEVFKDIKFILTSELRTKILISLYSSEKSLKSIQEEIDKPLTALSHGVRQLKKIELIKKEEKIYNLSSNGKILAANIIKLIENTHFINDNRDFWKCHKISDIPERLLKQIHYIHNARHVDCENGFYSENSEEFSELVSKSRKVKILTPIFFDVHLKMVLNNLNSHGTLELITTEEILDFMRIHGHGNKLLSLKQDIDIKVWKFPKDFELFLSSSDNFLSLGLFSNEYYDNSSILLDESKNGVRWGLDLFEHFKKDSELVNIEEFFDIFEGHE